MDLVNYLFTIYGYDKPIFIKDVRIGRKSKSAIREEFYRATKNGKLERRFIKIEILDYSILS